MGVTLRGVERCNAHRRRTISQRSPATCDVTVTLPTAQSEVRAQCHALVASLPCMSWLALWGQIASSGPLALHAPEHDTYCDRWRVAFVIPGIEGANVSAQSHPHCPWEFTLVQKEYAQRRCGRSQELSNAIAPLLALSHQMDAKVDTECREFGIVHLLFLRAAWEASRRR